MTRTLTASPTLRMAAATVGVAGVFVLAGCAGAADTADGDTGSNPAAPSEATADSSAASSDSAYTDGTYTADGVYQTPESVEQISVTVTLEDDIVTAVEVTGDPQARETETYQAKFIGGISDEVVGKDIDEISVSRVAGSSLTSGGFNDALDQIKVDAAA